MHDDAELLQRYVQDRSDPAFTALVQRHLPVVYAVALRRVGHDAHLAEDVAQKVFTDLARKASSLRGRASLTGWLYVSAHHASAAVVRTEQRRKVREGAALTMQTTLHEASLPADWEQVRPLLDELVVDLKDPDREAVVLRFFHRRSFAEIGAALQLTEEAARKRVERSLDQLRAALAKRGVTSTAGALCIVLGESALAAPSGLALKVAATALADAAVIGGGASTVLALLKTVAPTVAATVAGLFFLDAQRNANRALQAELSQLDAPSAALTSLREENHRLARLAVEADELRRTQADLPALRAALAAAPAATPAVPTDIDVAISATGSLSLNGKSVTLREFLEKLKTLRTESPTRSILVIHADAKASADALRYVLDEARKAEITRLSFRGPVTPPPTGNETWF